MKKIMFIVIALSLAYMNIAYADCWYQGRSYPTGTIIDGRICQADGTWRQL
jgi:hypothetical protein